MIEIVKYADELGFSFDISTNASLVTESIVKELSQLKNLSYVHVSLDGATQKLQEQIRGIGTFKPTIKGIQLLKKYGIYVRI
jgi:MoaA/NifB/PqqE/SkfB family radical SAM enzyme